MILTCYKLISKENKKNRFLCNLNCNKNLSLKTNSQYVIKDKNVFYFDLPYFIFDNINNETIKWIDDIVNNCNGTLDEYSFLNSEMWNEYRDNHLNSLKNKLIINNTCLYKDKRSISPNSKLIEFTKSCEELRERITKINNLKKNEIIIGRGIFDINWLLDKASSFDTDNEFKNYMKSIYPNDIVEILLKELLKNETVNLYKDINNFSISITRVDNEIELVYSFLDIIFNSSVGLNLKKCIHCKKYFFTIPGKQTTCSRRDENGKTCLEHVKDDPIKILEEKLRQNNKNSTNEKYDFNLKKYEIFNQCNGDTNTYLYQIIRYFSKGRETRISHLKSVGLPESLVDKMEQDDKNNL